ncbi:MAG: hypothetical protein ABI378_07280 [Chitinophagaceae bacterium]
MKHPKYQLKSGELLTSFEFVSEGPKGVIRKRIQFTGINLEGVYNLAFGDEDEATGGIDDLSVSNNGDSEKVLATVVSALYAFCDYHPEAWVFASGSTDARTRLYRIGIARYFDDIKDDFEIYGQVADEWQHFKKNVNYVAFLARRKIVNLNDEKH